MKLFLGMLAAFAISGCAFADSAAYIATGANEFGTVDLNTGSFNDIGNLGFTVAGLGEINGTLYTGLEGGTTLYKVDTANATTTPVGDGSMSYLVFGSTNNALYTVNTVGSLYRIDPATGATTLIGSTFLPIGANNLGLSTGSDNLYIALGSTVYTIDTTTGAATYVGDTGLGGVGALVSLNSGLFGGSLGATNDFYQFDQHTAAPSFLAASAAGDYAYGLAPIVPEPASVGLFAMAFLVFGGYAYQRRRIAAKA